MVTDDRLKAQLLARLERAAGRAAELESMLAAPEVARDGAQYSRLAREHGRLRRDVEIAQRLRSLGQLQQDALQTIEDHPEDAELQELARDEMEEAVREQEELLQEYVDLLLSHAEGADRNVIMEIRAGTGGEEAALFAGELQRMYMRYAERKGWKVDLLDWSGTDLGGVREVVFCVAGRGVWGKLRHESGGHRVQRVPETESQGRIHTSLATVAVLPEVEDVEVDIDPADLEVDFIHSSGPGGQHVNKTSSCVRIVHKPTGVVVRCQDQKSQQANRKRAMAVLRARLYEKQRGEQQQQIDTMRRSQVGSGDRNERVRTYNFPQDRVTDHRVGLDLFGIETILSGECDRLFDALEEFGRAEQIGALARSGEPV
jgi:peptide chain release factor 1